MYTSSFIASLLTWAKCDSVEVTAATFLKCWQIRVANFPLVAGIVHKLKPKFWVLIYKLSLIINEFV